MKRNYSSQFVVDDDDWEYLNGLSALEREKELARRADREDNLNDLKKHRAKLMDESVLPYHDNIVQHEAFDMTEKSFLLGRTFLYNHAFHPNFNIVTNGYIRLRINDHYEICKIVKIKKTKNYEYTLDNKRNKKLFLNIGLVVEGFDKTYSDIPIINISDSLPKSYELTEFAKKKKITKEGFSEICRRFHSIVSSLERVMTSQEVDQQIKNRDFVNPKEKSVTEIKIELTHKREDAFRRNNYDDYMKYQKILEEVEDKDRFEDYLLKYGRKEAERRMRLREEYLLYLYNPKILVEAPHLMKEHLRKPSHKKVTEEKPYLSALSNAVYDKIPKIISLPSENYLTDFNNLEYSERVKIMNQDIDVFVDWYDRREKLIKDIKENVSNQGENKS